MEGHGKYHLLGETRMMQPGRCLTKLPVNWFALSGGPHFDRLVETGGRRFHFPNSKINSSSLITVSAA